MHNGEASKIANCVILTISNDLPFAQQRFCESGVYRQGYYTFTVKKHGLWQNIWR